MSSLAHGLNVSGETTVIALCGKVLAITGFVTSLATSDTLIGSVRLLGFITLRRLSLVTLARATRSRLNRSSGLSRAHCGQELQVSGRQSVEVCSLALDCVTVDVVDDHSLDLLVLAIEGLEGGVHDPMFQRKLGLVDLANTLEKVKFPFPRITGVTQRRHPFHGEYSARRTVERSVPPQSNDSEGVSGVLALSEDQRGIVDTAP